MAGLADETCYARIIEIFVPDRFHIRVSFYWPRCWVDCLLGIDRRIWLLRSVVDEDLQNGLRFISARSVLRSCRGLEEAFATLASRRLTAQHAVYVVRICDGRI